jgi:hypothetical protein
MIWKILGTIGAASFFFTGFAVVTDPNCITADIGGGRVVGVTCRADSYGAFSGGAAGGIMLLIGTSLLALIYWNSIQRYLGGNSTRQKINPRIESQPSQEFKVRTGSIKSCDKCGKEMEINWGHCPTCLGTTFTHKQKEFEALKYSSEEAMSDAFPSVATSAEKINPEFKDCPMCAEQIKFAAKKCRYCQHLLDA